MRAEETWLRRESAWIVCENPAHLADAAKYVKEAWDSILPILIENCFRKVDLSIQYSYKIESHQEIDETEQICVLIDNLCKIDPEDITEFLHVNDQEC